MRTQMNTRRAIAAAVTGSAVAAYLSWGRPHQLRWAPFLLEPVQVISFVMTQRMLRGIKERAQAGEPCRVQA